MGIIFLYTGEGGGKTTNALGLALRALGHGQRVVIIQLMKWWEGTGEYKFLDYRIEGYKIFQCGKYGWKHKSDLDEEDKRLAHKGLILFKHFVIMENPPELIVLDEVNLAVAWGLLTVDEIRDVLIYLHKKTTVVMTGRYAPKELMELADVVNEIVTIKDKKNVLIEGINY